MASHDLITIPNAILRSKSKRIGFIDDSIRVLAEEMQALTRAWDHDSEFGVALAAIQVGEPLRLAVVRNNLENAEDKTFTSFVNPQLVKISPETALDIEGCLSVPGIYGKVRRSLKVKVKAQDLSGREVRLTATGFVARVFQHEIDHMNGLMFLDHINSISDLFSIDREGKLTPLTSLPANLKAYSEHA